MSPWQKPKTYHSRFPAAAPEKPKRSIWSYIYGAWKRILMSLGLLMLVLMVYAFFVASAFMDTISTPKPLGNKLVLLLNIDGDFSDHRAVAYGTKVPTMRELTAAIDEAAKDKRVKAFVAVNRVGALTPAHIYELRRAIERFNATGKKSYFYTPSFSEVSPGIGGYYLASAFSEIWMQPVGSISLPGLQAEMPFARGLMDKVGVEADMFARKEYKNVFESFTSNSMSEATRKSMSELIGDMAWTIRDEIAKSRGMSNDEFQALINRAMIVDKDAVSLRLVDRISSSGALRDHLNEVLKDDGEGKVKIEQVDAYARNVAAFARLSFNKNMKASGAQRNDNAPMTEGNKQGTPIVNSELGNMEVSHIEDNKDSVEKETAPQNVTLMHHSVKPSIALIYAEGAIVPYAKANAAAPVSFMSPSNISAMHMVTTFHEAINDDNIKVILLRINSPGGSPAASETIRIMILEAQKKDKKVVVSMGDAAASGGYWISAPADHIFATPLTLTGSIGVAGGKFVTDKLWEKLGVKWDSVQWGDHAGMWSMNDKFDTYEAELYGSVLDHIYDQFVERVAEGRKMTYEQADKVARGRVWTGRQAQKLGLVDSIGGLDDAMDYAARLAGAQDRQGATFVIMPKPKTAIEKITELLEMQVSMGVWFSKISSAMEAAHFSNQVSVYDPVSIR
jgi:protease-4